MKVLAVGAHPDDVEIGCGGALARHSRMGDDVTIAVITSGDRKATPGVRRAEAAASAEVLGARLIWGNGQDGQLDATEVNDVLEEIVQEVDPDIVYTHGPSDTHSDHRAVCEGVNAAARNVPSLLYFESPSALTFQPNVYVDIEETLETKRNALSCHRSQLGHGSRVDIEALSAKARSHGFDARLKFAEAFVATRVIELTRLPTIVEHRAPNSSDMLVTGSAVSAVIFDLDDTLYSQRDWLDGAWTAVARAAAEYGVDAHKLNAALSEVAARGSDQGKIIDQALEAIARTDVPVTDLVEAFLGHAPTSLDLFPGVDAMLTELRDSGIRVGVVSDGTVRTQDAKIEALGLRDLVDVIVLSDSMGRRFRKPHPRPVLEALAQLDASPAYAVVIGDRPDTDVASAAAAGVRAIRVKTGEYGARPDHPFTWRVAGTAVEAVREISEMALLKSTRQNREAVT